LDAGLETELRKGHFRVAIFGSARIEKGDTVCKSVHSLARIIPEAGMGLVTGGGPGLMSAASEGYYVGRKSAKTHSVGLRIKLPMEENEAGRLDIKREFDRFLERLNNFV
jgi:predicted Rossmann-fold nucleotide-binding protein